LTITGVAEGLAQDARLGGIGVNLQRHQPGTFVACFGFTDLVKTESLSRKGQTVTITGVCLGKQGKNVVLNKCTESSITKPGDPPQGSKDGKDIPMKLKVASFVFRG